MNEDDGAPSCAAGCREDIRSSEPLRDVLQDRPELLQGLDQEDRCVRERVVEGERAGSRLPHRPRPLVRIRDSEVGEGFRHGHPHPIEMATRDLQSDGRDHLLHDPAGCSPSGHLATTVLSAGELAQAQTLYAAGRSLVLQPIWWAREVLNLRPLACEASALPLSYAPSTAGRIGDHARMVTSSRRQGSLSSGTV